MIEIKITKDMIEYATNRVNGFIFDSNVGLSKFGSERERTLVGYIGENMVMKYLGLQFENDDYDYDISYRGEKLEVKTISCKFQPCPDYLCTVNSHNLSGVHKQHADYYVFVRILNDKSLGWLLGYMPCTEFFQRGKFIKKGTEVIKGVDFVKANATVLEINKLYPIDMLKNLKGK